MSKALRSLKDWEKPHTINTDKAATYGAAISELKAEGKCPQNTKHRQLKYLNNIVEADHFTLHSYPGMDHAFCRFGGAHYDAANADLANGRSLEFFRQHLS